jgi:glycosyltransferase involved in cell wall biosynthesis
MTKNSLCVAHIISPKTWRGGEQQAMYLVKYLQSQQVAQYVVCQKGSLVEAYCLENKISFVSFKIRFGLDIFFAFQLFQFLKKASINLIHLHDSKAHSLGVITAFLFKLKTPMILHRRVDYSISRNWFSSFKYNFPLIKRIICVSNEVERILQKDLKNKYITEVIYDCIDTTRFPLQKTNKLRTEFGFASDDYVVANIAALSHQKDYFTFIDTVKILISKGFVGRFVAFGDGPEKQLILDYAKEQGMLAHITFAGYRTDMPELIRDLDLLLFTSQNEGLGSSILDCFYCGIPIVSTDAGGIKELITHNFNGYLANVKDANGLAAGVLLAYNNPKIASLWVENAKAFVERFYCSAVGNTFLELYEEVVYSEAFLGKS